jgi:hypothetical protein
VNGVYWWQHGSAGRLYWWLYDHSFGRLDWWLHRHGFKTKPWCYQSLKETHSSHSRQT